MKQLMLISLMVLLAANQCFAAITTSLVGDKDGFGLTGAPAVPTTGIWQDYGGTFPDDNRDAGDPTFTDIWEYVQTTSGPLASPIVYTHTYSLSQPAASAILTINEAGMSDGRGPWDIDFNGTSIGQIGLFPYPDDESTFKLLSYSVPVALLTGSDTVTLTYLGGTVGEGFAINFSELTVAPVPAPGAILLGSIGVGLVGWLRRRKTL